MHPIFISYHLPLLKYDTRAWLEDMTNEVFNIVELDHCLFAQFVCALMKLLFFDKGSNR